MIRKLILISVLYFIIFIVAIDGIVNYPDIIHKVSPEKGPLYFTERMNDLNIYYYIYDFDLSPLDKDTRSQLVGNLSNLSLDIYDPTAYANGTYITTKEGKSYNNSHLQFKVALADIIKKPYIGKLKYRLNDTTTLPKGKIIDGSSGPEITTNFRNELAHENGGKYDYSVEVNSSLRNLDVFMMYKLNGTWLDASETKLYNQNSSNGTKKRLVWRNYPYYREIEFKASPAVLKPTDPTIAVSETTDIPPLYLNDLSTLTRRPLYLNDLSTLSKKARVSDKSPKIDASLVNTHL